MKAFFKHQPLTNKPPCQSTSRRSCWSPSFWGPSLSMWLKIISLQLSAHVNRVTHAILLAVPSQSRKFSVLLLIVSAPLVGFSYLRFDESGGDTSSYWNLYFFLFAIRGELFVLTLLMGFWMKFDPKDKVRYALFVPASYVFGRIGWLSLVTDNEGYHSITPWAFLFIGLASAVVWFALFDYLMGLHFHKTLGPVARLKGLRDCPDMPDSQKVQLMGRAAEELEAALKN